MASTSRNAGNIKARIITEGANGPVTDHASASPGVKTPIPRVR